MTMPKTLSIMTFTIMALSIEDLFVTFSMKNTEENKTLLLCECCVLFIAEFCYAECYFAENHFAECHFPNVIILNDVAP